MAIKFPLKMADGIPIWTLEKLQEHFDLPAVLAYYDNGKLAKWLENGYYDDEAKKVSVLDRTSSDFTVKLCEILGLNCSVSSAGRVDLNDIAIRNQRLEHLKRFTRDDTILAAVERVAFTQEELEDLLNKGVTDVYLLGNEFIIPEGFEQISYQCINNPVIKYGKLDRLEKAVEQGDTEALADIERLRTEVLNDAETAKWYRKAAKQGSAEAQYVLGYRCCYGGFTECGQSVKCDIEEAVEWYRKAAEQGHTEAQYELGICYYDGKGVKCNSKEAVKWFRNASEKGCAKAQYKLGYCYNHGIGVERDYAEAVKWYSIAAGQGYAEAQYRLGYCYYYGWGVAKDFKESVKWYRKAAEQGHLAAQGALVEFR